MELTTLPADELAFLAAIRAQPWCDTARLVYADYLDGKDTRYAKCRLCCGEGRIETGVLAGGDWERIPPSKRDPIPIVRCPSCSGSGEVVDTGDRDRADLIRVGVKWAELRDGIRKRHPWPEHQDSGCSSLVARESALVAANPSWLRSPCPTCSGGGNYYNPNRDRERSGECPACGGTGDLFQEFGGWVDDTHTAQALIARLERGFVTVTAPASRYWQNQWGHERHYTGVEPTPWLRAVARDPRVAELRVSDRNPTTRDTLRGERISGGIWYSDESDTGEPWYTLPHVLFKMLGGGQEHKDSFAIGADLIRHYPTELAAVHALSSALLAWAWGEK